MSVDAKQAMTRRTDVKMALCYLVSGACDNWRMSLERFASSYQRYAPGLPHDLYVVEHAISTADDRTFAAAILQRLRQVTLQSRSALPGIVACLDVLPAVTADRLCFLSTDCELICDGWLARLSVNLDQNGVGLVGATGSFESPSLSPFPNIQLRPNAFAIERARLNAVVTGHDSNDEATARLFEGGAQSLTRRMLTLGQEVLVVGRNGRGYGPRWWPHSDTFRQGRQANLLIADDQTRAFDTMTWYEKRETTLRCWGAYLQEANSIAMPADMISAHS